MVKRLGALLTLLILLLGTGGYYPLFFKLVQWNIREEMEQQLSRQLSDDQLTVISLYPEQVHHLTWSRKGKEFDYHGKRYDVVRQVTAGGIVHLYCLEDAQETVLFAGLQQWGTHHVTDKSKATARISIDLLSLFATLLYSSPQYLFAYHTPPADQLESFRQPFLAAVDLRVISPPPEGTA